MAHSVTKKIFFAATCVEKVSTPIACHVPKTQFRNFKITGCVITVFSATNVIVASNGKICLYVMFVKSQVTIGALNHS